MVVLTFVQKIIVGILTGYLALTNTFADFITSALPSPQETPPTTEEQAPDSHTIQNTLSSITKKGDGAFTFLRTHAEFQRAAVVARSRDEVAVPENDALPLSDVVKNALVNIFCQYKTDTYIRTTTGTGFFINQKGVILTNAHVAQFLLLKNTEGVVNDVECVIRTGDPATPQYEADLLYISPKWVFDNSEVITEEAPRGTGERDYALLYVARTLDRAPLPTTFPAISVSTALLARGIERTTVTTAGYPAEALFRYGADAKLTPVVAETILGVLYTFGSNYADLFSISDSPVGEQGASGGPVVTNNTGDVIGLIVTKGDPATEGEHSLRALTLSYIDRTIIEETGYSLIENTQGDVALRGAIFKKAMVPFLAGILEEELRDSE